ncbi:hypothetical protein DV735_g5890, partial [Chaetothyriales sp. CBS 134920]
MLTNTSSNRLRVRLQDILHERRSAYLVLADPSARGRTSHRSCNQQGPGLESLDIPAEDFLAYYDTDDIATILESLDIPAEDFLAYYDTDDIATILAAIDHLGTYVEKAGPFDGVLGFSQGADAATHLPLLTQELLN